jgi:hypothetical protein
MVNSTQVSWLLHRLCVQFGFCLPPTEHERLVEEPPGDPDSFTRAVFVAEGLDPAFADKRLYRKIKRVVEEEFGRSRVNGATTRNGGDGT